MMDVKSLQRQKKTADGLIKRTSSMLDEIESKTIHKDEYGDWSRKKKQDPEWSKASQKHK